MGVEKFIKEGSDELNPAKRASGVLTSILEDGEDAEEILVLDKELKEQQEARAREVAEKKKKEEEIEAQKVAVKDELHAKPVVAAVSGRNDARMLLLTRDQEVFTEGSLSQKRILELAEMFAEVHVVVLEKRKAKQRETNRLSQNAWLYSTNSKYWLMTIWDARRVSQEQLKFGDGFRADIVLSEDPFECGVAGALISGKYKRPFQIHITEDIYDPNYRDLDDYNKWRLLMSPYTLGKADCIRTKSEYVKDVVSETYGDLEGRIEMLPMYHNLSAWRDAAPTFDLHTRYPQYKFILLHVTNMDERSHTDSTINGIARILRQYPTVGLVVVGDGPKRGMLEKHVLKLGLQNNVVFEPGTTDLISHIKSANVVMHTSENPADDFILLQAAASGTPLICGANGLAMELFIDGSSALLCPLDSPPCLGEKVSNLLNNNHIRIAMAVEAQNIVFDRIEQDYGAYMKAYRDSIERCFVVSS